MLLGTSDIVSFISNTSREYKYFYFRRFNNYTIVFISEIVIQNSEWSGTGKAHQIAMSIRLLSNVLLFVYFL